MVSEYQAKNENNSPKVQKFVPSKKGFDFSFVETQAVFTKSLDQKGLIFWILTGCPITGWKIAPWLGFYCGEFGPTLLKLSVRLMIRDVCVTVVSVSQVFELKSCALRIAKQA